MASIFVESSILDDTPRSTISRAGSRVAVCAFAGLILFGLVLSPVGADPEITPDRLRMPSALTPELPDEGAKAKRALKRDYSRVPVGLRIVLPPPSEEEEKEKRSAARSTGPLMIGFHRDVPGAFEGDLSPRLEWDKLSGGSLVSALSVTSPGAQSVLVGLRAALPPGGELRFFGEATGRRFAVLTPEDFPAHEGEATRWSPPVEGDTIGIEIVLPSGEARSALRLSLDVVAHVFLPAESLSLAPKVSNCPDLHVHVACRSASIHDNKENAVALIIFQQGRFSWSCSGTLLNDRGHNRRYFLTANHCVGSAAVAGTVWARWFYQNAQCDAGGRDGRYTSTHGGTDLMATSDEYDLSLLRFRKRLPGGLTFSGWDANPVTTGTEVYVIHHPEGTLKKYAAGSVTGITSDRLHVRLDEGTSEHGSSGSGLFLRNGGHLVGGLKGGDACASQGVFKFGKFEAFFPQISSWLNAPPPLPTVVLIAGGDTVVTEGEQARFSMTVHNMPPWTVLPVTLTITQTGSLVDEAALGLRTVHVNSGSGRYAPNPFLISSSLGFGVTTVDDDVEEPDGAVEVRVEAGSGYEVYTAVARVVVKDNDGPPPPSPPPPSPPPPPPTVPSFVGADTAHFSIAPDHADGAAVGTVSATDADGDALTYSLGGIDRAWFSIDDTGLIAVAPATALAGLGRDRFSVTAQVSDGEDEGGLPEARPAIDDTLAVTITAFGVQGAVHRVPFLPPASHPYRQGFVRVINRSTQAGEVSIVAFDDAGTQYGPLALRVGANATVQFNSADLEEGNAERGLSGGMGDGKGDWRLELTSALDIEALAYVRTPGGALASVHDVAPEDEGGHRVGFFNPASNRSQVSRLRLINPGEEAAAVRISGIDAAGEAGESAVALTLAPRASQSSSAQALESGQGEGLVGALGDGAGKWRLRVTADRPVRVMSLLASGRHLTNVSTAPGPEGTVHRVALVPGASHRYRDGVVRVINRSAQAGEVSIVAFDDAGVEHGPLTLRVEANAAVQFSSADLEEGNAERGLSGGVGDGKGDWRLELTSALDLEVLAYVRTPGGPLASVHDVAPEDEAGHRVGFFNPASNRSQVSRLRLINPGEEAAAVRITGIDAAGEAGESAVALTLAPRASRSLSAQALESGQGEGLAGALGDGEGKWRLRVTAERPIRVMSLLASGRHLTNVSTAPASRMSR